MLYNESHSFFKLEETTSEKSSNQLFSSSDVSSFCSDSLTNFCAEENEHVTVALVCQGEGRKLRSAFQAGAVLEHGLVAAACALEHGQDEL